MLATVRRLAVEHPDLLGRDHVTVGMACDEDRNRIINGGSGPVLPSVSPPARYGVR